MKSKTAQAASRCTEQQIVVPIELWKRMRMAIFRIQMGREVCAGSPAYDPGLCDKAAVDKLIDDIQRHNMELSNKEPNAPLERLARSDNTLGGVVGSPNQEARK
jgi:hypothetical protein